MLSNILNFFNTCCCNQDLNQHEVIEKEQVVAKKADDDLGRLPQSNTHKKGYLTPTRDRGPKESFLAMTGISGSQGESPFTVHSKSARSSDLGSLPPSPENRALSPVRKIALTSFKDVLPPFPIREETSESTQAPSNDNSSLESRNATEESNRSLSLALPVLPRNSDSQPDRLLEYLISEVLKDSISEVSSTGLFSDDEDFNPQETTGFSDQKTGKENTNTERSSSDRKRDSSHLITDLSTPPKRVKLSDIESTHNEGPFSDNDGYLADDEGYSSDEEGFNYQKTTGVSDQNTGKENQTSKSEATAKKPQHHTPLRDLSNGYR